MKRHNDLPLSSVLKQWAGSDKLKPMLIQKNLEAHWEEWFGKLIAKNTEKISIRNQKLYIHIKSGPVKYELNLGRQNVMNLLNQKLGENYLEEVIVL